MFCPKRKGFFPIVLHKFTQGLTDEEERTFIKLETLEDRIDYVRELIGDSRPDGEIFRNLIRPVYGDRNSKASVDKREAGNAAFYEGSLRQALMLYCLAVFNAPQDGGKTKEFSLALANR